MTDQELIRKAFAQTQRIAEYVEPDHPRNADDTLHQLVEILDRNDVVAAVERLTNGFGLRKVK